MRLRVRILIVIRYSLSVVKARQGIKLSRVKQDMRIKTRLVVRVESSQVKSSQPHRAESSHSAADVNKRLVESCAEEDSACKHTLYKADKHSTN
jgi:hypothetical protein